MMSHHCLDKLLSPPAGERENGNMMRARAARKRRALNKEATSSEQETPQDEEPRFHKLKSHAVICLLHPSALIPHPFVALIPQPCFY